MAGIPARIRVAQSRGCPKSMAVTRPSCDAQAWRRYRPSSNATRCPRIAGRIHECRPAEVCHVRNRRDRAGFARLAVMHRARMACLSAGEGLFAYASWIRARLASRCIGMAGAVGTDPDTLHRSDIWRGGCLVFLEQPRDAAPERIAHRSAARAFGTVCCSGRVRQRICHVKGAALVV